jgi:hypothetical protein
MQGKTRHHHIGIGLGVLQPGYGIRREVRVVPEDLVWTGKYLELHEETVLTHVHMQRIERFHVLELSRLQEGVSQG